MTDIFDNNDSQNNDNKSDELNADDIINVFADKLSSIKNSDGNPKYDSVEKALDALVASQEHIKRLEDEAKARQLELESAKDIATKNQELQELLNRMTQGNDTNTGKPDSGNPAPNGGLNEDTAAELVRKILNEDKQKATVSQNLEQVTNKLVAKYGDKAQEVVATKAQELKTTPKQLQELAAVNPNLVLALFGDSNNSQKTITSTFTIGARPVNTDPEVKVPEKSILSGSGATTRNQMDVMAQIRNKVNKRLDVTN